MSNNKKSITDTGTAFCKHCWKFTEGEVTIHYPAGEDFTCNECNKNTSPYISPAKKNFDPEETFGYMLN